MHNDMIDSALARSTERLTKHGHEGVIKELVSNSWDAIRVRRQSEAGLVGRVQVTYARDEMSGEATIIVADNGCGMSSIDINRPFNMDFFFNPVGSAGRGGKFNVGSKSWMATARSCTYITRDAKTSQWIGAVATEQDIQRASSSGLNHIPHASMATQQVAQKLHELSARFNFSQTRSEKKSGVYPASFCPVEATGIGSDIGTIVIYEGVGAQGLYVESTPTPPGDKMIIRVEVKLGTHFARPINDGALQVEVAHLGLSGGRLKDSPSTRDNAFKRVKGVSQISDLSVISDPEETRVISLPGGETIRVKSWICGMQHQVTLKRALGQVAGLFKTEVMRTSGDDPAAVNDSSTLGANNEKFIKWQARQGVDIIRNGEYVYTVRLPGFKRSHNKENYWRIEVEYEAGQQADSAIRITSDRQNAAITHTGVFDACLAAYRNLTQKQSEIGRIVREQNAAEAEQKAAAVPAHPAKISPNEDQFALLEAKLDELSQQNAELKADNAVLKADNNELMKFVRHHNHVNKLAAK